MTTSSIFSLRAVKLAGRAVPCPHLMPSSSTTAMITSNATSSPGILVGCHHSKIRCLRTINFGSSSSRLYFSTTTYRTGKDRILLPKVTRNQLNRRPRQVQDQHQTTTTNTASSSRRQQGTMVMQGRHQTQQQQQLRRPIMQSTMPIRDQINLFLNQPRSLPIPRWISPQRVTFTYSEVFGHASFFLVAISYAVDDFVLLRLIAVAGCSAMLVFTYFHPHGRVLWLPFRWNVLFIVLNGWRIAKVYTDRYWSENLISEPLYRHMYDHHFYVMEKTDFARLLRLGTTETFHKGEVVVQQGQDNRYVRLVLRGDLKVDRDGQITYMLHEGQFISESGLHAGLGLRGSVTSCCTVSAASDNVELLRWDRTELMRLLELHKSIERAMKAVMSWDIVSKLKSQRILIARGEITDIDRWTEKRREQTLSRYKAILQNMLAHPDYLNKRKGNLAKYREIHHIQMSEHVLALKEMGWTTAEFEAGAKDGQLDEDKLEKKEMGFLWWLHSWWNAL